MKTESGQKTTRFPVALLLIAVPLFAAAAWAGIALANRQVPPESLEQPPPLPIGSTLPIPEGRSAVISADPAELRDYHFTLAAGGDWQAYLRRAEVKEVSGPATLRVKEFDADLVRVTLEKGERVEETWVHLTEVMTAAERQRRNATSGAVPE
jgi:hypothetical protein